MEDLSYFLGFSLSTVFNFTGNNESTLMIGSQSNQYSKGSEYSKNPGNDPGFAFLLFSQPGNQKIINPFELNGIDGIQFKDASSGQYKKLCVSSAGNFNGDGKPDLLFGSIDNSGNLGVDYLVFNPSGNFLSPIQYLNNLSQSEGIIIQDQPLIVSHNDDFKLRLGSQLAYGNFNTREYTTLILLSLGYPNEQLSRVGFIFGGPNRNTFGSPFSISRLNGINGFNLQTDFTYNFQSVSSIGDINDNGLDDVGIITKEQTYTGVLFGRSGPFNPFEIFDDRKLDGQQGFRIPQSITLINSAGNPDQDKFNDFIACASTRLGSGACWFIRGRDSFPSTFNLTEEKGIITFTTNKTEDFFGLSAGAFFNSDLYIGAPGDGAGTLYVLPSNTLRKLPDGTYNINELIQKNMGFKVIDSKGLTKQLGFAATSLENFNGRPAFAVSAPMTTIDNETRGKVFVFYHNATDTSQELDVNQLNGENGFIISTENNEPIYANGMETFDASLRSNVIPDVSMRGPSATQQSTAFRAISGVYRTFFSTPKSSLPQKNIPQKEENIQETTAWNHMGHSIHSGATQAVTNIMHHEGHSPHAIRVTSNLFYFATYFMAASIRHAQTPQNDSWQVLQLATLDTVNLFVARFTMDAISDTCALLSNAVKPHSTSVSSMFSFLSHASQKAKNIVPFVNKMDPVHILEAIGTVEVFDKITQEATREAIEETYLRMKL